MIRRITVILALIATTIGLTAAPSAAGGNKYFSKTSGETADAYWTQIDGTPVGTSQFGNVHIGSLYAYKMSANYVDVFAYIEDFDCEEGEVPYGGGGHGVVAAEEEPPPDDSGCAYVGSRFGYGQNMELTIDSKLTSARLTGSLVVEAGGGHGGGPVVGNPGVDITFTGIGDLGKGRYTYRFTDGGTTYSESQRSTFRQATVDGFIGAMTFAPDLSGGNMTKFSSTYKERSK